MQWLLSLLFILFGCQPNAPRVSFDSPLVVATVSPYQSFAEELGDGHIRTQVLIPPGSNPHLFEPTPQTIQDLQGARLWFGLGEPVEQLLLKKLRDSDLRMVNLSEEIGIGPNEDNHIWMSVPLTIKQIPLIASELAAILPDLKEVFEQKAADYLLHLKALESDLKQELAPLAGRALITSHGALGYFCADYGLIQLTIESEGKSPLPEDLAFVLQEAKAKKAICVFVQAGFDNRGALEIAKRLSLPVVTIEPHAPNYIENMRSIANHIVTSAQEALPPEASPSE